MSDNPEKWMVLGASPCAEDCHCLPVVDAVAGAGASILLRRPDVYFVYEVEALWTYEKELDQARELGTKVILGQNLQNYLSNTRPPSYQYPCDEFLPLKKCNDEEPGKAWEPGIYVPICGGGLALQWAINHGAREIHLVGMEGYQGKGHADYFTGEEGNEHGCKYTEDIYAPLLQRIVAGTPDIHFVVYGAPVYDLNGDNVECADLISS